MNLAKEIETYTTFYNLLLNDESLIPKDTMPSVETAFRNCMAYAAEASFGPSKEENDQCLQLLRLSEKFMYFSGCNEQPDETPWILACIRYNAFYTRCGIVHPKNGGKTEQQYKEDLLSNFSLIEQFKPFRYIGKNIKLKHGDRIDVFCEEILSNRPVIIELKIGNKSGHKQLRSYAVYYDDPILINISETHPANERSDIKYYIYDELIPDAKVESFAAKVGRTPVPVVPQLTGQAQRPLIGMEESNA